VSYVVHNENGNFNNSYNNTCVKQIKSDPLMQSANRQTLSFYCIDNYDTVCQSDNYDTVCQSDNYDTVCQSDNYDTVCQSQWESIEDDFVRRCHSCEAETKLPLFRRTIHQNKFSSVNW